MKKAHLRPKLNFEKAHTSIEQFQNEVLRPILKLQNDLLLIVFNQHVQNQKIELKNSQKWE